MKKFKIYYLVGKEWLTEKWNGSVMDKFLVSFIACILLFLLLALLGGCSTKLKVAGITKPIDPAEYCDFPTYRVPTAQQDFNITQIQSSYVVKTKDGVKQ